ncbi:S8 family peptidase [Paenibacillus sp. FSL L8-0463]|uniref:S8 family peptidase n=1 Tax=Paenibacillus sp. FSL L8-0463 TaxID=2954687 RepID=UPI00311A550E
MPDSESKTFEVTLNSKENYMIAPNSSNTAQFYTPMSASTMNRMLSDMGLDIVKSVKRKQGSLKTLGVNTEVATDIVVAKIDPERAELLKETLPQNLSITKDEVLTYGSVAVEHGFKGLSFTASSKIITTTVQFKIIGIDDQPISKVMVQLVGDAYPSQNITDENGMVSLEFVSLEKNPSARLLVVTPTNDYWDIYNKNPEISFSSINTIKLKPLFEKNEDFKVGWGQQLIGLSNIPKDMTGAGIKVAIIDSGCDNQHKLLKHINLGMDFTSDDASKWNQDEIGHGTHCAGVIAARNVEGSNGFAPEAEVHILKIFPGGSYSSLIEALDYCVEHKIDVVNMSLGADTVNATVEEALNIAAQNGIACIVAAGNSGNSVRYPASSPYAFAVAAIGNIANIQKNTWDSTIGDVNLQTSTGMFWPKFSCYGPEISVCAPGVAIISTVPGGGYKAESGTSMAAPHITGIATLLLAHHPLFKMQFQERNIQRVTALFELIRSLCVPSPFDATRTGAGIPVFKNT